MRVFDIDYIKLVRLRIPPHIRQPKHVTWLLGLCNPISFIYLLFLRNRNNNIYRLKITPQVCYMEKMLNDRYDISERRIKIVDSVSFDPLYIFLQPENKPVYIFTLSEQHPVYIYTYPETTPEPVDFVIQV